MTGRKFAALALLLSLPAAAGARTLAAIDAQCGALTSGNLQLQGGQLLSKQVTSRDACCQACAAAAGCQLWWVDDSKEPLSCSLHSVDKGPVTLSILYAGRGGLMTAGPASLVTPSGGECDGDVWLFRDTEFVGGDKGSPADPYAAGEPPFGNGTPAMSWQECCRAARRAPGTTIMERSYQYRARQYWTYSAAQGRCWVKVRPYLQGAVALTMKRAPGTTSGMFGNEL